MSCFPFAVSSSFTHLTMNSIVRSISSSLRSLSASARGRCSGHFIDSCGKSGFLESFRDATSAFENLIGQRPVHALAFSGNLRGNGFTPCGLSFRSYIHSDGRKDVQSSTEPTRNFTGSMEFVRGILEQDGRFDSMFSPQGPRHNVEQNIDIVHIKLMRNNTFITVTDSKGNTKLKASAGRLEELKGGPKLSRYAAEATAEYVGRESRKLGLKSVIMRVKGFTYFKKKKNAIMSWKEGFTDSGGGQHPIVYLEDTTRRPHNGCRLPKRRRI